MSQLSVMSGVSTTSINGLPPKLKASTSTMSQLSMMSGVSTSSINMVWYGNVLFDIIE